MFLCVRYNHHRRCQNTIHQISHIVYAWCMFNTKYIVLNQQIWLNRKTDVCVLCDVCLLFLFLFFYDVWWLACGWHVRILNTHTHAHTLGDYRLYRLCSNLHKHMINIHQTIEQHLALELMWIDCWCVCFVCYISSLLLCAGSCRYCRQSLRVCAQWPADIWYFLRL